MIKTAREKHVIKSAYFRFSIKIALNQQIEVMIKNVLLCVNYNGSH